MNAKLVFQDDNGLLIIKDITIDPDLGTTVGIFSNKVDYLFQCKLIGINWDPRSIKNADLGPNGLFVDGESFEDYARRTGMSL